MKLYSPALYRFAARRHAAALVAVALVPIAIGGIAGLLYDGYASKRELVVKLLDSFPMMKRLLDSETLDFFTPAGFFNIAFRHPLTFLTFGLVAGIPALTCPAGDRGRGTLDLLLAGPMERGTLVRTAGLFGLSVAALIGIAPLLGALTGAWCAGQADAVPMARYLVVAGVAGAFTAALAGAALWISAASDDAPSAISKFAAFFIVTMLVDALSMMSDRVAWIRWLSFGGYYRASEIVAGKADLALSYGVLLGVFVVCVLGAARTAERRNRA